MRDQERSERGRLRAASTAAVLQARIRGAGALVGESKRTRARRHPNEPKHRESPNGPECCEMQTNSSV